MDSGRKLRATEGLSRRHLLMCAVVCLMLFAAFAPASLQSTAGLTTRPGSASTSALQPNAPSVTNPIQLTRTSSDNFFLPGRNSVIGTYYLSYLTDNAIQPLTSDDTPRASSFSVGWSNSVTGEVGYSYPTVLGGLQAANVTLSPNEAYSLFTPGGGSSIEAQQDQGTLVALETNTVTQAQGEMLLEAGSATSAAILPSPIDVPPIAGEYNQIEAAAESYNPSPSSWGNNLVGVADITLSGTSPTGPEFPVVLQLSLAPGANYDTWQQVSPSDWYAQSCPDNVPQVFRPTLPVQALASGSDSSDYFWTRVDIGFAPCMNTIVDGPPTGVDIVYGSNSPVVSFATNATSFQGVPCTPAYLAGTCFEGLVGAWGNIVLYSVSSSTAGSDNLWLYDLANNVNVLVQSGVGYLPALEQAGALVPGMWSDGNDFALINSAGKVVLYDGSLPLRVFNANALFPGASTGLVRVGGGWVVWLNSSNIFNFYNIASGKQFYQPVDISYSHAGMISSGLISNFDFENGEASWVVTELSYPEQISQLVLFTVNATAGKGFTSSSSLSAVSTRTVLGWASPGIPESLSIPQVILSSTGGWTFVNAIPTNGTYYQVYAFPTPQPSCSYTAATNGAWTNPYAWGLSAPPTNLPAGCTVTIPSGLTVTVSSSVGTLAISDAGNVTVSPGGTLQIVTYGRFSVSGGGLLSDSGKVAVDNYSTLTSQVGGTVAIGGVLNNNGTITNGGTLIVSGTLNNAVTNSYRELSPRQFPGGTITNTGTMVVKGSLVQSYYAAVSNSRSGSITIQGLVNIDNFLFTKPGLSNYGIITISNGGVLKINDYGSLTNGGTGTVNVAKGGLVTAGTSSPSRAYTFLSIGNLNNNGTITNAANFLSTGTLTNSGLLNSSSFNFVNTGTITNTGTIINAPSGKITNTRTNPVNLTATAGPAVINNYGVFNITKSPTLGPSQVVNYGPFSNYGTLNNGGILETYSRLFNFQGGRITIISQGTMYIWNTGTFGNSGGLRNYGTVSNHGSLSNSDFVNNTGTISNTQFARFNNTGEIINSGTIVNYGSQKGGLLLNEKGGSIVNGGGVLQNYGIFSNSGNVTIDSSGSVVNYGTVDSNGTIQNGGSFVDACQGMESGVSGKAPTTTACSTPAVTATSGAVYVTSTQMINGTSDANAEIVLTYNGATVGRTTADSTGNWTATLAPIPAGPQTLVVQAIGTNGNSTTASVEVTIEVGSSVSATATSSSASTLSSAQSSSESGSSTGSTASSQSISLSSTYLELLTINAVVVAVLAVAARNGRRAMGPMKNR